MTLRIEKMVKKQLDGCRGSDADYNAMRFELDSLHGNEKINKIREKFSLAVDIDSETLICGSYPPFEFWNQEEYVKDNSALGKYKEFRNTLFIAGGNHKTADFEYVINNGIRGYLEKIDNAKQKFKNDSSKLDFLNRLRFVCDAVIAWTSAHSDACQKNAENQKDEIRKRELLKMAEICKKVPFEAATNFYEAIQSYFFVFSLFPDGVGRLDQYLYPFYKNDVENGLITENEAFELIENLFVLIFARQGKYHEKSGSNHGVISGYTTSGECGHNECTSMILKAITDMPIWRPQFSYRYTANTPREKLREVIKYNLKRPDLIMFLNDEVIIKNLERLDINFDDAVKYSVSGCNETIVTGCSQMGAIEGHINLMYSFDKVMTESDKLKEINTFEEFYKLMELRLKKDLNTVMNYSYERDVIESSDPLFITSLFTDGCIEKATSVAKGGAKYNNCTWCLTGLVNLSDSLSIIKQIVFEEKILTLEELSIILSLNWQGYEHIRTYILNKCRFFGNDDDYADGFINRIAESVCNIANEYTPYRGGKYIFGTLTGYEISHVVFGQNSSASPDGRYKGDAFAASISTAWDSAQKGVTAFLKSAAKIKGEFLPSSVVVNLTLDRSMVDSEDKADTFTSLLSAYFSLGGVQLQINYLSPNELADAQCHPERYKNLRVRVTGFSGFFTTFEKALQDEIINRSLHQK